MAERRHEIPEKLPEAAGKFVALANEMGDGCQPTGSAP